MPGFSRSAHAACGYAGIRTTQAEHAKHNPQKEIIAILDRYVSVWASPSPLEPPNWEPPEDAVDTVDNELLAGASVRIRYHRFVGPAGDGPWVHVRRLAALPLLARLNYTKQLSTTHIGLNIDATHNRLSHLLGTLDACAFLLQEGCETATRNARPDHTEAVATLLLALMHDAYHGPFGHSLDRIGDLVLSDEGQSRIDKALLIDEIQRAERRREGDIWQLALLAAHWTISAGVSNWRLRVEPQELEPKTAEQFAAQVIRFLGQLTRAEDLARSSPTKYWLREIVDGPLDADRLDYLMRDTEALRRREQVRAEDVHALISGIRVREADVSLPVVQPGRTVTRVPQQVCRVYWDIKTKKTVEDLISVRSQLYMEVYEAPEKRALDEMLAHTLVWVLRSELDPPGSSPTPEQLSDIFKRIAAITDDELFHFLYEVGTKPHLLLPMALVHDLAVGRPFKEVWRFPIPWESLPAAKERMRDLAKDWEAKEKELSTKLAGARGIFPLGLRDTKPETRLLLPKLGECLTVHLPEETDPERHRQARDQQDKDLLGMVYLLEWMYGRSFKNRERIERMLWQRLLCANEEDPALAQQIRQVLLEAYERLSWPCSKPSTEAAWQVLQDAPLIFLSIPWVPPPTAEDVADLTKDLGLANWDIQQHELFHRDGEPTGATIDLAQRQRQEFYPISVYLPAILASSERVQRLVGRLVGRLIYSLAWYCPEETQREGFQWWAVDCPSEHETAWLV